MSLMGLLIGLIVFLKGLFKDLFNKGLFNCLSRWASPRPPRLGSFAQEVAGKAMRHRCWILSLFVQAAIISTAFRHPF